MDKKIIQKFLKYVIENPFKGKQQECGIGKDYWNSDLWTIEVAACLFLGEEYILPEGYENNKNADPNRIKKDAEWKIATYANLQKIQLDCDAILVSEVGRGLDILMASMVKKWKIYCYDQVDYGKYLKYFGDDIIFFHKSTTGFDSSVVPEDVILIHNHSIYKPFETKNIVHVIDDGELKW